MTTADLDRLAELLTDYVAMMPADDPLVDAAAELRNRIQREAIRSARTHD
ncbi:MAG TPA: hypothetical protein VD978_16470 [Azospirillum sp.]|nr:hypothetical protein [Azospirillum sp.]